ncbi:MAG: hypothetical protein JRJ27_20080 [Deltaproteobacteria bacterium]|nr:hypothetical protein [Deltaproteobacteria bacterium]
MKNKNNQKILIENLKKKLSFQNGWNEYSRNGISSKVKTENVFFNSGFAMAQVAYSIYH